MMKTIYHSLIIALLFFVLFMTSCTQKQPWEIAGVSEDFYIVAKDLADHYLQLDADGYRYDQALHTLQNFLEGKISSDNALNTLQNISDYFENELANCETITLDNKLIQHLQALNISATEYEIFVNFHVTDLGIQNQEIMILTQYLQSTINDELSYHDLIELLARYQITQDGMRGYHFYHSLNYWLPSADDAELTFLQKEIIDKLTSYFPETTIWCSTREASEKEAMYYLDQIEVQLNNLVKDVGKKRITLYKLEQELKEKADV